MPFFHLFGPRTLPVRGLTLAVLGLLLAISAVGAGEPPPGGWPWMRRPKVHGYDENRRAELPPVNVTRPPVKYTITITVLPPQAGAAGADVAEVMAHLPEDALLWIDGYRTRQRGELRHFESPPLEPGRGYSYTARAVWFEDGSWVSETKKLPVSAGSVTCLYLTRQAAVTEALAKLGPEDRKLAEAQRSCAVQPGNLLGSMGTPVKVLVKGRAVFLCCEGCTEKALADPDKTLAAAEALQARGRDGSKSK